MFYGTFAVCIHINNVDPKVSSGRKTGEHCSPLTVDIIQNSCGQFVQTNDL